MGEWNIVDPNKYDREECVYYNEYSRRECESSARCSQSNCSLKNANKDCSDENEEKCAPEHQDIKISREIRHPKYGKTWIQSAVNDIMLFKLSEPATFNTFVKPLCLPDM